LLILNLAYVFGGAEKSIADICERLKEDYEILFLIENKKAQKLLEDKKINYKIIKIGEIKKKPIRSLFFIIKAVFNILFIIFKFRPNILMSNTNRSHLIASIISFITFKPLIWILRDYKFNNKLQKLFSIFPKKIICVSEDLKQYYITNNHAKKYKVIPNGLDINKIKEEYSLKYRRRYANENEFLIGIASNFARWKGIEYLIQAFYRLDSSTRNCNGKLLIAGSAKEWTDSYKYYEELKALVEKLGLSERVVFLGWIDDIHTFFYNCDVIVSTSITDYGGPESFGRTIMEAWGVKKPVVVTNVGGPKYIVDNNINGIKTPEKDYINLFEKLDKLNKNEKLRLKLGEKGYEKLLDIYSLSNVTNQYDYLIQKI
jgi:glycosyltransferase involved in cell wall biosynthesis